MNNENPHWGRAWNCQFGLLEVQSLLGHAVFAILRQQDLVFSMNQRWIFVGRYHIFQCESSFSIIVYCVC